MRISGPGSRLTRLTGVAAWRNLNFIAARGFETVTGIQDVPTGFQLFGHLGHGVPTFIAGQQGVIAGPVGAPAVTTDAIHDLWNLSYLVKSGLDLFTAFDLGFFLRDIAKCAPDPGILSDEFDLRAH